MAADTVLEFGTFSYLHREIFIHTPSYTEFFTKKLIMATSASTEPGLKRTAFALSPEERALGSSLENDLHPLYQRVNFKVSALTYDTTGEEVGEPTLEARVHERMVPAFRLASLLLEFSLPFFAKVFCADLVYLGEQFGFDRMYECTDADIQRVRNLLVEWADRTRFYCRTPDPVLGPNEVGTHATSEIRVGEGSFPKPGRSLMSINIKTIEFFSQENYDEIDAETKTSRLVQLAFTLVHEQAHAVFCHRWAEDPHLSQEDRDFISRVTPREPMYHLQMNPRYHELGFALQAWIHGGSVLSRGKELIYVAYPEDVLGEATSVKRYTFRAMLLSADLWRAIQSAPRPSTVWNKINVPLGWLGQAMSEHAG